MQGKIPPLQTTLVVDFLLFPFCNGLFCLASPAFSVARARRFYLHSADRNGGTFETIVIIISKTLIITLKMKVIPNCIIPKSRSFSYRKEHHCIPVKAVLFVLFSCEKWLVLWVTDYINRPHSAIYHLADIERW